jgi:hypothetical protein
MEVGSRRAECSVLRGEKGCLDASWGNLWCALKLFKVFENIPDLRLDIFYTGNSKKLFRVYILTFCAHTVSFSKKWHFYGLCKKTIFGDLK